ncbi:MAG: hypothetical protein LBR61_06775 [Synergistaceae bacterium]|jgi:hypothetical protein|nr:hypothetical protein [Synergistaceae bacterium]
MRKEFKYLILLSILFAFVALLIAGLRLPWTEEGAIFAVFGASAGFCAAIIMSMLMVWKMNKNKKR